MSPRKRIDDLGLKHVFVARKIGVDPSQLSRFLKWGVPLPEEASQKLAKLLEVPSEAILKQGKQAEGS